MANHFVALAKRIYLANRKIDGRDIAAALIHASIWDFSEHTPNTRHIGPGDHFLLYVGNDGGCEFIAEATAASSLRDKRPGEPDPLGEMGVAFFKKRIDLRSMNVWPRAIPIRPLIGQLDFIKKERDWGLYLRRGLIRIPEKDFRTIASLAASQTSPSGH